MMMLIKLEVNLPVINSISALSALPNYANIIVTLIITEYLIRQHFSPMQILINTHIWLVTNFVQEICMYVHSRS